MGVTNQQHGHGRQFGIRVARLPVGLTSTYAGGDMAMSKVEPSPEVSSTGVGGPGGPDDDGPDRPAPPPRPPRQPMGPIRRLIRELGLSLITAGVVVLLFVGYQLFGTNIVEANSQNQLRQQWEHQVVPTTEPAPVVSTAPGTTVAPVTTAPATTAPAPAGPTAPIGAAVAHLVIPKIGVDQFIVEGVSIDQLRKGPGHYPQTPLPGEKGNAAIAGHRTTYGAPFYRLNELNPGDDIFVTTRNGQFHYTVALSKVVKPSEVAVLSPTPDNRLTLTTCHPRFSASSRLVVVSRLVDTPAPTVAPVAPTTPNPSSSSSGVAAAGAVLSQETPLTLGTGDHKAWPAALFFGGVCALMWLGVRLWGASVRSQRWVPYAVGIPLCLIPLWFAFENAIRLLPANI
jgi:sortase A